MEVAPHMPYAPNIVFRIRGFAGLLLAAPGRGSADALGHAGRRPLACVGYRTRRGAALPHARARRHGRAHARQAGRAIVQLNAGTERSAAAPVVRELGGQVTRDLHIINVVVAKLPAAGAGARDLAARPGVKAVSLNGAIKPQRGETLATSFNQSIQANEVWSGPGADATGAGVGVAVVDTGMRRRARWAV
jgi:hypothetical protein